MARARCARMFDHLTSYGAASAALHPSPVSSSDRPGRSAHTAGSSCSGLAERAWSHPAGRVSFISLAATALLLGSGCAALTRPVVSQQVVPVPSRTNEVVRVEVPPPRIVYVTNTVAGAPVILTNWIPSEPIRVTNLVVVPPTNMVVMVTNVWEPAPGLVAGIQTAQTLNGALNPTPSAPLVNWGLTALGGVATLVAGWQTRRAQQQASAKATADALLETTIKAVETYPGRELDQVKLHIARVAALTGVADQLDERVQTVAPLVADALADGKMDASELLALALDPRVQETDIPEHLRGAFRKIRA